VRITRHGPVVSDSFGPLKNEGDPKDKEFVPFKEKSGVELPDSYVIALKWTALSPSTPFEAIWGFDRAQNWEEFRAAARKFHVPAQNLVPKARGPSIPLPGASPYAPTVTAGCEPLTRLQGRVYPSKQHTVQTA